MSKYWQNYLTCILLQMILPFLPITFELWQTSTVSEKSLTLATSMYSISIGISSRNKFLFSLTLFISLLFGMAFGLLSTQSQPLPNCKIFAIIGIVGVFISHSVERYFRHIKDKSPFLEFEN